MIRFSAVLVAVAIGVLIGGVVTSKLLLVYVAIGLSAAALLALAIGVVLKRAELFGEQTQAPAAVGQPALPQSGTADIPVPPGASAPTTAYRQPPRGGDSAAQERGGQPGHRQPGHGQPGHGQPGHGQPGHGQPGHGQPGHGPSAFGEAPAAPDRIAWESGTRAAPPGGYGTGRQPLPPFGAPRPVIQPAAPATAGAGHPPGGWSSGPDTQAPRRFGGSFRPDSPWPPSAAPSAGPAPAAPAGQSAPAAPPWREGPAPSPSHGDERGSSPAGSPAGRGWTGSAPTRAEPARPAPGQPLLTSWFDRPSGQRPQRGAEPPGGSEEPGDPRPSRSWPGDHDDPKPDTPPAATAAGTGTAADVRKDAGTGVARRDDAATPHRAESEEPASRGSAFDRSATSEDADVEVTEPDGSGDSAARESSQQADDPAARPVDTDSPPPATGRSKAAEDEPVAAVQEPRADETETAGSGGRHDDAPAGRRSGSGAKQVTVIPGVPRYHDQNCILIRFMTDEDVQRMTVDEAAKAGCTPCRACQPGA